MPLAFIASPLGRWAAVGLIVLLLGWGLYKQIQTNGGLKATVDHVTDVANGNAKLLEDRQQEAARANKIAADAIAKNEEWRKKYAALKRSISDAKPEDDGPLAPVLRRTLDELRGYQGSDPVEGFAARSGTSGGADVSGRPGGGGT